MNKVTIFTNDEKKEQIRKQYFALNRYATEKQFEAAYPALLELYKDASSETFQAGRIVFAQPEKAADDTTGSRSERSMADVILERQRRKS